MWAPKAGTKPTYFFPSQVPRFHWSLVTLFPEVGGVVVPILGDQHHLWLLGVFSTTNGCQSFDLIVTDTTWNSFNIPTLDVFSASLRFRRWDQGYTFARNTSAWGIRLPLFCGCGRSASPGIEGIWKVITKKPWASKTYHFSDFPWRKNDTFSFNPPFKKGLISLRSSEISSYSTNEDRDCLIIPNIQSLFLSPESSIHHWWVTGINPYHRLPPIQPRSVHYQLNQ